jgi:Smg protein
MFDILVYLFENYAQPGACPESSVLARKLSAIGFDQEDISAALEWLSGLASLDDEHRLAIGSSSQRLYCAAEQAKLTKECRGFLYFLENALVIDPVLREMIIERAMVLRDSLVSLDKLKIIVLMVLWRRQHSLDTLLLEELLSAEHHSSFVH